MDMPVSLNARCFIDSVKRTTPGPCAMLSGLWGNIDRARPAKIGQLSTPSVLLMNAANQRAATNRPHAGNEIYLSWCVPSSLAIHEKASRFFAHPLDSSCCILCATPTTMTTTTVETQTTAQPRLAIKNEHLAGLDPEWVELWHTYGAHMTRADEMSLEEYRKNPALYSFTYPTCAGQSSLRYWSIVLTQNRS
jgi:hypothetical protein